MATKPIEVYAVVDDNGDYEVGTTDSEAIERYTENVGELNNVGGFRIVKLVVNVPLPAIVTLTGEVNPPYGSPVLTEVSS